MANEISVSNSLAINYPYTTSGRPVRNYSRQKSFQATINAAQPLGPTPGQIAPTTTGVQIVLSQLTNPGMCWIENTGEYRVQVGIKDTSSGFFEPVIELLPGEGYAVRLARNVGSELTGGVGTGTAGSGGVLWAKAVGGTGYLIVEAHEG